ncbi:hypothetical protein [Micromonospora tulbaghiae]|uniref:hypothetical protein n=1 Tax=Micromonospora tulbaghiae TaxID=479978 RepID=UPI00343240D9
MTIDTNAIRSLAEEASPGPWVTGADKNWSDALPAWALIIAANYPLIELDSGEQGVRDAEIARLTAANQRLLNRQYAATPDLVTAQQRADQAEDRAADLAKQVDELKKRICLVITCTDCGEALEWDGGIVHFRNLDEAKDILDDENWRVIDGNPMCGDCLLKPHDFKPEQPNGLTCERCDLEADDHEPVAAKAEVA